MLTRTRARWQLLSCVLAVSLAALASACGSSNGGATVGGGDGGREGSSGKGSHHDGGSKVDSNQTILRGEDGGGGVRCQKLTCEKLGFNCGTQSDGCGGMLECGTCATPETCGGGGKASQCGGHAGCVPTTCVAKGVNCGPLADGCGGLLQCGTCSGSEKCGGGGGTADPGVCATPAPPPDAPNPCKPTTCAALDISCGPAGDGCGGSLSCGGCSDAETCGGGGTPSKCGSAKPCTKKTCAELDATCGTQADGCGGTLSCGTCAPGDTCGGGGTLNKCGQPTTGCTPKTCAELHVNCGPSGDGCGGTIAGGCGGCDGGTCGGGGTPNQCGSPPICVPATSCAAVGVACGVAGDGCGGTITCPDCPGGTSCGGGGTANQCGMPACTKKKCNNAGPGGTAVQCGVIGDGCGGTLTCGTGCTAPATCGGGGVANMCGGFADCVPQSCAQQGFNCGLADDTCGGAINCGGGGGSDGGVDASGGDAGPGCTAPQVCGGGGIPNQCGPVVACTGLCLMQTNCDGGPTTTLTGTVFAPNGSDPIYDAVVYVPNGTVEPFSPGLTCGCNPLTGDPLVQATTGVDGTFTLSNVPAGVTFPLVIQLGPWRRQVMIPAIAACTSVDSSSFGACNAASAADATSTTGCLTSFPTVRAQGDIPLMALVTGQVDALECVFRKIGIQDGEFGDPGGPNRMQLYLGDVQPGATYDYSTPLEDDLWTTQSVINGYDLVLFACQGKPVARDGVGAGVESGAAPSTAQSNVIDYTNLGGRVFATHYNYTWLYDDTPFSTTANWNADPNDEHTFGCEGYYYNASCGETGNINMGFPRGLALAQWLQNLYPATVLGQIQVNTLRDDFGGGVVAPSLLWMSVDDSLLGTVPLEMTFDTPVGTPAAQQCGRVEYEDYHVEDQENAHGGAGTAGQTFPNECDNNPMTPQEKLLEFQLFDLSSCVGVAPTCTPLTCATAGVGGTALNCGLQSDGCGNILNCGTCTPPETCGGGGTAGVCGGTTCMASTCGSLALSCGSAGDGCGGTLTCGTCGPGTVCTMGMCVTPACTPLTCDNAGVGGTGINCGTASDGCGGTTGNCGMCTATGTTCGGGGTANICGGPGCAAATCTSLGLNCGTVADGCGGTLSCGTCSGSDTCGGGGASNICGHGGCNPKTCSGLGFNCGPAGDGCGGELSCGTCTAPETCGGGGHASVCGGTGCTATTCSALGFNCGPAGDGCGGKLQCGTCAAGMACGAGGHPGVCAPLDAGGCVPETCAQVGVSCGPAGDGCGGEITSCGSCAAGQSCGAGGTPGQCGSTGCKAGTCSSEGFNCGPAGDGCGGALSCGSCTLPETCGGGGTAGQCGKPKQAA